jgi:hypothetical protein
MPNRWSASAASAFAELLMAKPRKREAAEPETTRHVQPLKD